MPRPWAVATPGRTPSPRTVPAPRPGRAATAHIVQAELGSRAHALDVTNACNGFAGGIETARARRQGRVPERTLGGFVADLSAGAGL